MPEVTLVGGLILPARLLNVGVASTTPVPVVLNDMQSYNPPHEKTSGKRRPIYFINRLTIQSNKKYRKLSNVCIIFFQYELKELFLWCESFQDLKSITCSFLVSGSNQRGLSYPIRDDRSTFSFKWNASIRFDVCSSVHRSSAV